MEITLENYRRDPSLRIALERAARRDRAQRVGALLSRAFAALSRHFLKSEAIHENTTFGNHRFDAARERLRFPG